jgi:hypothetical protein
MDPPRFEQAGRTVVIRPAEPLEPGRRYRIQVRTGLRGVAFQVTGGGTASIGAPRRLEVPFTTASAAPSVALPAGPG